MFEVCRKVLAWELKKVLEGRKKVLDIVQKKIQYLNSKQVKLLSVKFYSNVSFDV